MVLAQNDSEQSKPHDEAHCKGQSIGSQPDVPLKFSHFLRALECPKALESEARERTFLLVQKCRIALSQWKELGYPDLGGWPDVGTDLLEYSYQQLIRVIEANHALQSNSITVQT